MPSAIRSFHGKRLTGRDAVGGLALRRHGAGRDAGQRPRIGHVPGGVAADVGERRQGRRRIQGRVEHVVARG